MTTITITTHDVLQSLWKEGGEGMGMEVAVKFFIFKIKD